jgi:hypothetical protein
VVAAAAIAVAVAALAAATVKSKYPIATADARSNIVLTL